MGEILDDWILCSVSHLTPMRVSLFTRIMKGSLVENLDRPGNQTRPSGTNTRTINNHHS